MNAELKAKWVEALRSGSFSQARGVLHDGGDGYCCLGVLSLVAFGELREARCEYILTEEAGTECGLSHDVQDDLARLNDGSAPRGIEPHNFPTIADYIEKNL